MLSGEMSLKVKEFKMVSLCGFLLIAVICSLLGSPETDKLEREMCLLNKGAAFLCINSQNDTFSGRQITDDE